MKIIRPEQPVKKIDDKEEIIGHKVIVNKDNNNELISDSTSVIKFAMYEALENTKDITFTITLTKKQKELWDKKGGIKWLKKALVGQKLSKK